MLNVICIAGRLVRDPEMRRTQNGAAVVNFTIACDRDFGKDGVKETDFFDVVVWRNTAEFVSKYFSKGRMAVVSGRLQKRSWTDKDGNNRSTAEIVADSVYFGDSKSATNAAETPVSYSDGTFAAPASEPAQDNYEPLSYEDNELPF